MAWWIRLVVISVLFCSCKTTDSISNETSTVIEAVIENHFILIQFKNPEGLKRMLYRQSQFKLEMVSEVSVSEYIYKMKLDARPYEIEGIVQKMGMDEDVVWVKRVN